MDAIAELTKLSHQVLTEELQEIYGDKLQVHITVTGIPEEEFKSVPHSVHTNQKGQFLSHTHPENERITMISMSNKEGAQG